MDFFFSLFVWRQSGRGRGRRRERETEREEREGDLLSASSVLKCHIARLYEARNSIPGPSHSLQGPKQLDHHPLASQVHWKEAGLKGEWPGFALHSDMGCRFPKQTFMALCCSILTYLKTSYKEREREDIEKHIIPLFTHQMSTMARAG